MSRRVRYTGIGVAILAALAAGLWLLFAKTGPTPLVPIADAATLAQVACNELDGAHFDMTAKVVRPDDDNTYVRHYTFAGPDFRLQAGLYNPNGPHKFHAEWIVKDGVWYERYKTDEHTWGEWMIRAASHGPEAGPLPCGDPESASYAESGDRAAATSTANLRKLSFAPVTVGGGVLTSGLEVDSLGRPVTGFTIDTDASTGKVVGRSDMEYSDIGKTNTITAPITPPTPRPTRTPTPTPDVPEISIAAGSNVTEGGNASFTLTASPAPAAALSVSVTVSQAGDFGATTGTQTVTIPTSGSATLSIATTDDSVDEADGSITVTVASGSGYTVGSASAATVTVSDNDVPEISISGGSRVTEGGNTAFTLAASPVPHQSLSVNVTVTASGDYGATTGTKTVTIPTGGSATLTVATSDDSVDEADGSVTVTVNTGTGYAVSGSKGAATVTVADNDAAQSTPEPKPTPKSTPTPTSAPTPEPTAEPTPEAPDTPDGPTLEELVKLAGEEYTRYTNRYQSLPQGQERQGYHNMALRMWDAWNALKGEDTPANGSFGYWYLKAGIDWANVVGDSKAATLFTQIRDHFGLTP